MMRLPVIAALGAAVACGGSARQPNVAGVALTGQWSVSYTVDSNVAWRGHIQEPVQGVVTLMTNRTVDRDYPRIGVPAAYGVYDVNFSAWGFTPAGSALPTIVGGATGGDSIEIRLDSDRRDFEMTMDGRLRGDSVRGRWIASDARAILGHGNFTMRRLATCDTCRH
jgi:hypothetical protein